MKRTADRLPRPNERQAILAHLRNEKMARSAHAFVRGSTARFYAWLDAAEAGKFPEGPPIWICGDCHLGNLGPIANTEGRIDMHIRDFDQTVVGNPAHDLIRLGLSLATTARGCDLPGIATVMILEQMIEGYEQQFIDAEENPKIYDQPKSVRAVLKEADKRSWRNLAKERIEDCKPSIPLGKCYWPLSRDERRAIDDLFQDASLVRLATALRSRDNNAQVHVLDAAYWVKGCSSLGQLRFAVLLDVGDGEEKGKDLCLIDIKEALKTDAPRAANVRIPRDHGKRVLEGARHLSPYLGERMCSSRLLDHPVFVRELLPQDLKLEIAQLTSGEAIKAAKYVGAVVGQAHARQMDSVTRARWRKELQHNRSKALDAPSWLWNSIIELIAMHEIAYLEHCRGHAHRRRNDDVN